MVISQADSQVDSQANSQQANNQVDLLAATRVVPAGLSYNMLCAVCGDLVRKDVRTKRAPLYERRRIEAHLAVCSGPRTWKKWCRKMLLRNSA